MASEKLPKAIDLTHHLSDLALAREVSPLKGLVRLITPDIIMLGGGLPHPSYFPFSDLSSNVLVPDTYALEPPQEKSNLSWVWKLFGAGTSKQKTETVTVPKYASKPTEEVNLAVALQYGTAQGIIPLQKFVRNFAGKVYQPAYENWTTILTTGNTDAWTRAVLTLCNRGEFFLTEEWSYPSALASGKPYGILPVAIAMDSEGMDPVDLRKTLAGWDVAARGGPRPHVMYTVPIGQNPSGATARAGRKQAIYDICVEFDVIIVEDDPYYFLQMGAYKPKAARNTATIKHDSEKFIEGLAKSYIAHDYQGRVVRLDTFSKCIAPGSRLGWITCAPQLAERFERQGETTTQAPCGLGQSIITQLLTKWEYKGYIRWLHGLAVEYRSRRDYMIDLLNEEFQVEKSVGTQGLWTGLDVYEYRTKSVGMTEKFRSKKLFSMVPPDSGMFLWLTMHFSNANSFKEGEEETLEVQLFEKLAKSGVLVSPGWLFASTDDIIEAGSGHFRLSFSNATPEDMKKAVQIMSKVFNEFFQQ
ncbi:PLP-dependent transferase [Trametopsis cervina]|nr:PLP-dependent transferase [Trametopsis cervina]